MKLIQRLARKSKDVINNINLKKWKEEIENKGILLDSLWIFPERERTGAHTAKYWGNFIPQIPHQAIIRFTREGDWVLDPFAGSGTTLIKCKQLGRNAIGIELVPEVALWANQLIAQEPNPYVYAKVIIADSTSIEAKKRVQAILSAHNKKRIQLLILHPPYYNAIRFSKDPRDLSNAPSLNAYLKKFKAVIENFIDILEEGRYLVLVIGDIYVHGEWIPLGFYTMNTILNTGFCKLKSIVVKNIVKNRGKMKQEHLWQYRALKNGFYIFKHEYVMFFQKRFI